MAPVIDVHTHVGTDLCDELNRTLPELINHAAAAGVTRAVVSTFEGGPDVSHGNQLVMAAAEDYPGFVIPFVVYIPTETRAVRRRFPRQLRDWAASETPVRGIVLNPTMHPCDLSHREIRTLIDLCGELDLVVMLHYMAQWADSAEGGALLARDCRDITFLVPAPSWIPGALGLFAETENVFFDTSKSYGRMTLDTMRATLGIERVMFGSDSPRLDAVHELRKLQASGLTKDELAAVMFGNASAMFA